MSHFVADTVTLFHREMLRYRRDRAYWVGQIVFPLVFVGFIGFGLNEGVTLPTGASYVSHLASGVLVLVVGSGAIGAGFSLIQDRDTGFLRALLVAPIAPGSIVAGKLLARVAVSLALVAFLLLLLAPLSDLRVAHLGAGLLALCAVTSVFVALGVALAARLRRLESFRLFAALVTIPLYLFSGIFYPLAGLPIPLRIVAYANPLTYGVDLFRFGVLGSHELDVTVSAGMLTGLTAVTVWLAVVIFDRSTRE